MSLGELLFSFQGRLNRKPYWLTLLATIAVFLLVAVVAVTLSMSGTGVLGEAAMLALPVLLYMPFGWICLALGAKRLHDRDKSAWWLVVFLFVPGMLERVAARMGDAGFVVQLAGLAISIWAFVEMGCLRGTEGPNRFGPDPLSPPMPAAQARAT